MPDKDNSSLYLETNVARDAAKKTEYESLSQLVNALLSCYLEDLYDPWDDLGGDTETWSTAPHERERVRTRLNGINEPTTSSNTEERLDSLRRDMETLKERVGALEDVARG